MVNFTVQSLILCENDSSNFWFVDLCALQLASNKKAFKLNRKNAVLYVILVKGLAGNTFSRFMQIAGIMASLLSVARACSNIFIIGQGSLKVVISVYPYLQKTPNFSRFYKKLGPFYKKLRCDKFGN